MQAWTRVTSIEITYLGLDLKADGFEVLNNLKIQSSRILK